MSNLSLAKDKIRILLLEGIHQNAVTLFKSHGYRNVELLPGALDGEELKAKIADAHMIGIRSRTKLTAEMLEAADKLMAIGCFCIGTNQVALEAARDKGVPVFNAPYSNTRSVAELVIAEIIMLARGIPHKDRLCHQGGWLKTADGSYEVRGKVLGIIGYGHIGSQVSVLAESMGMKVRYFDIIDKLPLGNAAPCDSMEELLEISDYVTLQVPATPQTKNMFRREQIRAMKPGSILLNLARGNVVDIDALTEALEDGHLRGAAIDVFPKEPASKDEEFISPLRGQPNVILTPHVGGSTQEAQANIGNEVADKLVRYSDNGSTLGAVNFVEVSLPVQEGVTRFLHIHRNVPGVLAHINEVFSSRGLNIAGQYLMTDGEVGYVVVDISGDIEAGMGVRKGLEAIEGTIRTRFLK
ncbi:phosphoglycerate dehydrogenase [Magnetospira sp. QH-2]|uniref:phosphoglycerate dehydrogenase n=1 Tax=Magnetospira sp. (strain QH-2) TaxID=1288970 RepID=UPI0003E80D9E|nr:phosphoglycerate dehydrogenase [Magnetospira sp. QH-2]CCQ73336.1 D-3-phosphoglycerate dehydrogenase (PGDH) [Magnetospira sp. QH-2]